MQPSIKLYHSHQIALEIAIILTLHNITFITAHVHYSFNVQCERPYFRPYCLNRQAAVLYLFFARILINIYTV